MPDSLIAFNVTSTTPDLRFLASLSDGRTVIEDTREGHPHAWFRLQEFIQRTGLKITALRMQCPAGEFCLPSNQAGYAYGKKHIHVFQMGEINCVGVGYLEGEQVRMSWLNPADLSISHQDVQPIGECGFKLLKNPE